MPYPKPTDVQNALLRSVIFHHRTALGGQLDRGAEPFSLLPERFMRVEGRQARSARKLAEMGLIAVRDPELRGSPITFATHVLAGLRVPPKGTALLCDSILHDKTGPETQLYVEYLLNRSTYRRDTSSGLIASAFGQVKYDLDRRGVPITRLHSRTYLILIGAIAPMIGGVTERRHVH